MGRSPRIFIGTSIAAFGINAASHAWMIWTGNPHVKQHKATLDYRSALVGDSVMLPLVNVLLDQQLDKWDDGVWISHLRLGRLLRSVCAGVGITTAMHLFQGAQGLTNWTMPERWKWNVLGYYHAVYMATQLTFLAYAIGTAGTQVRDHGSSALFTRQLLLAALLMVLFAALLYKDYY